MMLITKYDEDEVYDGLQLVLNHDGDKVAFKFPSPFKEIEVPFVYDNKLMMLNVEHPFPIIISEEKYENVSIIATKLGDMILPIELDASSILKKPDDFIADVFDLTWFIITGQAKYTENAITNVDNTKRFIKEQIQLIDSDDKHNNENALTNFISQYWSSQNMVPYHPEMRSATLLKGNNDNYDLYIGSNDEHDNYNDHVEIMLKNKKIKHSKKPIPITLNVLIRNASIEDLTNLLQDLR